MTQSIFTSEERELAAEENMDLIPFIAHKYFSNWKCDMDEKMSVGLVGLANAVVNFNHKKGIKFNTYACRCIMNALYTEMQKENRKTNPRISMYLDAPITTGSGDEVTLHGVFETNPMDHLPDKLVLESALKKATVNKPGFYRSLKMYQKGYTFQEIGRVEGISFQAAQARVKKVIRDMEQYL